MTRDLIKITMAALDMGVAIDPNDAAASVEHIQRTAFLIRDGKIVIFGEDTEIPESGLVYVFNQETLFTAQNIVDHSLLTVLHPEFFEAALIDLSTQVQITPGAPSSNLFTFYAVFDVEITGNRLQGRYLGAVDLPGWINGYLFSEK